MSLGDSSFVPALAALDAFLLAGMKAWLMVHRKDGLSKRKQRIIIQVEKNSPSDPVEFESKRKKSTEQHLKDSR